MRGHERDRERDREKSKDRKVQSSKNQTQHLAEPAIIGKFNANVLNRFSDLLVRSTNIIESQLRIVFKMTSLVSDTIDITDMSYEDKEMMRMMGFCSFDTTKGKKVEGNDVGGVHVILKRKYRQYMNRKGGFNRPLDFVA